MKRLFFASVALLVGSVLAKDIDVVAVYYPHWHKYPKGTEWFGEKWSDGEWALVKDAPARYPGHRQPMKPLPGYLSGSDPKDVETEIALASNAGIDVFLYDYYYYGGKVTQEEAIEQGFLKAANRGRMKFALMWCYHERRDQFRPAKELGTERRMLMELDHTADEFLGLVDLSISRYFRQPEYWRKDGKLFFSIFNVPYMVKWLGKEAVKGAIRQAREKVRTAGLGELHLNAQGFAPKDSSVARELGFDSVTDYNIPPKARPGYLTDYESLAENSRARWTDWSEGVLPYFPVVSTGWDRSPRCRLDAKFPWTDRGYPYNCIVTNATPENFEALLRDAKAYVERDPKRGGVVYVNAWNEYTECPGLLPTVRECDFRLRAVARVFGRQPADKLTYCEMKRWWRKDAANGRALEIDMPTHENVKYGPHCRQGMDVWLPGRGKSPGRVPCVVYIHGGAWVDGSRLDGTAKSWLGKCREKGLAFVTITYRMIADAREAGIRPPVKAPVDDAMAAVRFVRAHADEWGIDSQAIGLTGGSAGACSSLIAVLTGDNSLGVRAVLACSPQTTLDPKEMREWIPNAKYGAHAFGYGEFDRWLERRADCLADVETYSPAALVRRVTPSRAPRIVLSCGKQPKPGELDRDPTHSPRFCAEFEKICRARGIDCSFGGENEFLAGLLAK